MQCTAQFCRNVCSRSLVYNSGKCILCHLQLSGIVTGRAVVKRVAVVKARGHNAERNHL